MRKISRLGGIFLLAAALSSSPCHAADRKNIKIAGQLKSWLAQKGLAGREKPQRGPAPLEISASKTARQE